MVDAMLDLVIVEGPVLITVYVIAALLFVYLLGREASGGWVMTAIVVLLVGAMIGGAALWAAVHLLDLFGGPVIDQAWLWVPGAFAAIALAVWNLWRSRWWRKLIAVIAIPVFALTAVLGINAAYGIDRTVGDLLGVSTAQPIDIRDPGVDPPPADPAEPLHATWQPPAGMPAKGVVGTPDPAVPNTVSGFPARPAEIYLPPAALVENPPRLPLVIMMMGQPGDPDATFIAEVLDEFAAGSRRAPPAAGRSPPAGRGSPRPCSARPDRACRRRPSPASRPGAATWCAAVRAGRPAADRLPGRGSRWAAPSRRRAGRPPCDRCRTRR